MRGKVRRLHRVLAALGITPAYAGKRFPCCTKSAAYWDHPRLCGEKSGMAQRRGLQIGSPPPMRGKVQNGGCNNFDKRDHPRLCGEKYNRGEKKLYHVGSPPPMRGKGNGKEIAHLLHGITPAYAGKSTWKCMPFVTLQDHPRLCGEKSYETSRFLRQIGSPPPMRGKDTAGKVEILAPGITPAYAGKSRAWLNVEDYR